MKAELEWMISQAGEESVNHLLETATSIHSCEKLSRGVYGNNRHKRERFRAAFRIVWRHRMEAGLTKEQLNLVALMCQGKRLKDVSNEMDLSYSTVQTMVKHINRRMNTRTIVEVVAKLAGFSPEVKP